MAVTEAVREIPVEMQTRKPARKDIITVEHMVKDFGGPHGVRALDDVSLAIADNELFTLLGPSGCGKTTLLRILAGFEHPTSGRVLLDAKDIAAEPPHKRPVNTMFQSYALFPHMTVAQNVAFGLEMLRRPRAEIGERVQEMLRLVKLDRFASRKPAQLSGGQQQRVALARALAPKPRVLLLDEPLSALDLKLRKEMQFELKRLQRETAITFVIVTHDQEEALALSDRIAVMSHGRVLQLDEPRMIYDNPANRFVADFIGEANLIPGDLLGHPEGSTVAVRPERCTLTPLLAAVDAVAESLAGEISGITFLGSDTLYEVSIEGSDRTLRARLRGDIAEPFDIGAKVRVGWTLGAARLLTN